CSITQTDILNYVYGGNTSDFADSTIVASGYSSFSLDGNTAIYSAHRRVASAANYARLVDWKSFPVAARTVHHLAKLVTEIKRLDTMIHHLALTESTGNFRLNITIFHPSPSDQMLLCRQINLLASTAPTVIIAPRSPGKPVAWSRCSRPRRPSADGTSLFGSGASSAQSCSPPSSSSPPSSARASTCRRLGPPPPDLGAEAVTIVSPSGSGLRGWYIAGRPGGGAVVLLHGVHANRLAMLRRARLLKAEGFAVLLFDLQAHGESAGTRITFGR